MGFFRGVSRAFSAPKPQVIAPPPPPPPPQITYITNTAPAPEPPDPVRLPSQDDPESVKRRRLKMREMAMNKQGRRSTNLSSSSQDKYQSTTLG